MFNKVIQPVQLWFEKKAFGVCTKLGEKLGIRSSKIRMYFVYLSFFTAGSPVIIYFFLAFWLEHRDYFKSGKHLRQNTRVSFWDI